MSKICYVPKKFDKTWLIVIRQANQILEDYSKQGLILTLRQLYYQFVARDIFPEDRKWKQVGSKWVRHKNGTKNATPNYKWLSSVIGDARLAGWIDWELIEDRSRNLQTLQHFDGPQDALDKLASWYHVDLWANQKYRPEVWIEKDALSGVIARVCEENDVPYFSCRGYTSLSEMWRTAERLKRYQEDGYTPYVIHFGDHDPSGIDMSRDIVDRIHKTFMSGCDFHRVALTMKQIEEYKPPPNPAKVEDPRFKTYLKAYGDLSWELDALEPIKFRELIEAELKTLVEPKQWKKDLAEKAKVKKELIGIAAEWSSIPKQKEKIISLEERLAQAEEKVVNLQRMVVASKKPAKRSYSQRLKKVVKKKSLKKPL